MKQNQIIREMQLRIEALEKEVALLRHQVERLSIEDESDPAANFHLSSLFLQTAMSPQRYHS